MGKVSIVMVALALSGCIFEAPTPAGLECSAENTCPPGQYCDLGSNQCRRPAENGSQCGDGVLQEAEQATAFCDLGVDNNNQGLCTLACKVAACGDQLIGPGEGCDDGDADETSCRSDCALPTCGDGIIDAGEACDDGNAIDTDFCLSTCVLASCGDRFIGPGELCDDGNGIDSDECNNRCGPSTCGDGVTQSGEECDDGNGVTSDSCLNSCLHAFCGDNVTGPGEECDDFENGDNTDACIDGCLAATCGDNFTQQGVEECDDGQNGIESDACLTGCIAATCGDALVHIGVEDCDDGGGPAGDINTDSCSVFCEDSWPNSLQGGFITPLVDGFHVFPNDCNNSNSTDLRDLLISADGSRITIAGDGPGLGGWVTQLDAGGLTLKAAETSFQGSDEILGLAHDSAGRILMIGNDSDGPAEEDGTWFGRFAADVNPEFTRVLDNGGKEGRDIAPASNGELILLIEDQIARYSSDGQTERFTTLYTGADASRMAVDAAGTIYAVGSNAGAGWLSKTDSAGAKLLGEGLSIAQTTAINDIAIAGDGTLFLVGKGVSDAWIAAVNPTDGTVIVEAFIDGPNSGVRDNALAVAIDSTGDVLVGGILVGQFDDDHRWLAKFRYDATGPTLARIQSGTDTWEHLESSHNESTAPDDEIRAVQIGPTDQLIIGAAVTTVCNPGEFGPSVQIRRYTP